MTIYGALVQYMVQHDMAMYENYDAIEYNVWCLDVWYNKGCEVYIYEGR